LALAGATASSPLGARPGVQHAWAVLSGSLLVGSVIGLEVCRTRARGPFAAAAPGMVKRFKRPQTSEQRSQDVEVRGEARAMFAAILLVIAGVLNVIYGIAAISNGDFFNHQTVYVVFGLGFWGWVTLIIGLVQLTGGYSLFSGGTYGRTIGIIADGLVVYGEPIER
jgi:hypothetical protein